MRAEQFNPLAPSNSPGPRELAESGSDEVSRCASAADAPPVNHATAPRAEVSQDFGFAMKGCRWRGFTRHPMLQSELAGHRDGTRASMAASQAHIAPSTPMGRRHLLARRDSALARFMRDQACPRALYRAFRCNARAVTQSRSLLGHKQKSVSAISDRYALDFAAFIGFAFVAMSTGQTAKRPRDTWRDRHDGPRRYVRGPLAALEAVLEQRGLPRANGHDSPELRR
jgi:hypothetical protein